jgi:ATP-binding cassette subfamily F protein uup
MQLLKIERLSKSFGEKILLDNISLTISKGEKIGLVAKNGSGKSTFLRIIAGQEAPEGETVNVHLTRDVKVGFLWQEPDLNPKHTVLEAVLDLDHPHVNAVKEYQLAQLTNDTDLLSTALGKMDELNAWNMESKVKETLYKLKVDDFNQEVGSLSGGQQKRLALAKLILDEPDFIILDEPTNHLDIEMIEWLENFLQRANITLFMVTHDRYFLERICNTILELDRGQIYTYKGNYSIFLEKRAARLENESVVLAKTKKLFKKELDWIRRQPKARGTKAKSRVDKFDDIKAAASKRLDEDKVELFVKSSRLGSKILELHRICKSFDEKLIIDDFSYKFKKKERVGIVGQNGTGKSTFLKILTEEMRASSGRIVKGDTVVFGHFKQEGLHLEQDKRIIEVVRDIAEYIPLEKGFKLTAESLLEKFLFPRSQQRVYVSQLSGGEKRRLHLLTILMSNPNFLILDEPTNDLDIVTLNILEDYLLQFPGCLIIVSHDRYFMDKLVNHMFVFEGEGKIKDFNGNYSEYRALKRAEKAEAPKEKIKESTPVEAPKAEVRKLSYNEKKEIRSLEAKMEKLEKKKTDIAEQFNNASLSPEKIKELSLELGDIQNNIEAAENRWLELSEIEG